MALGCALIADALPGSTGAWYLPDPANDRLVVAEAFGPAAAALRTMTVPVGQRLTGWVAASRQPIINSDADLDIGSRVDSVQPALSRCVSVPLIAGETLVAVLTVYTDAAEGFTTDHVAMVQIVAPHLASAIDAATRREAAAQPAGPDKATARELRLVASR
jgi:GAF domain-containing protein